MSATQMYSMRSKLFQENSLVEKRCFWSSFAFVFTWFLFTLFLCGALSVFLHIEFSQDLTQKVNINIENYKRKLESNARVMLQAEIQNIREEMETELQNMRNEMAEKLRMAVASSDNQRPVQRPKDLPNSENSDHGEGNLSTDEIEDEYHYDENVFRDQSDDGFPPSEYDSPEILKDGSTKTLLSEPIVINENVFKRNEDTDSFYKTSPEISIFKTGDRPDEVKDLFKQEKNTAESQTFDRSSRSPKEKLVKERTAKSGFANAESTSTGQQQSKLERINNNQNKITIDGEDVENAEMIFSHRERKKPSLVLPNSENSDHREGNSPTVNIKYRTSVDESDDGLSSGGFFLDDDQHLEISNDERTRSPLSESVRINDKVFKRNVGIDSYYQPSPEISIFKTDDRSDKAKDQFKQEKNTVESQTTITSSRSPKEKLVKERTAKSGFANAESTSTGQQQSKLERINDNQNKVTIDGEDVENAGMIFSHRERKKPSLAYLKMNDFKDPFPAEINQAESQDYTQALKKVVVAAHFKADSTPFKTQKQYYKNNDLVRHPTGEYNEWKVDDWHNEFQTSKHLNYTNGSVVVQNSGLYFVYGQIYYTEWADINGFVISKNNETALQCVTSTYGDRTKQELSNSCFTGGIIHCKHGDELRIRNAHPGRYVVLEATKSFFGMFKIADSFQTGP